MRTIQSMFKPMGAGDFGGGTQVLAEFEPLPNIRYALIHSISHGYRVNPAGMRTTHKYSIRRFEYDTTEFGREYWNETSFLRCQTKAEARKVFNATYQ